MNTENIPQMGSEMPNTAVSVYGQQDAMDDFPVLKAFQQYIDAEQNKARKRLYSMAIFFGIFTFAVIAIFVTLLLAANERNQALNDRLVEYVMKERATTQVVPSPVVVQQQPQADSAALKTLTEKLDAMRTQLNASEARHAAEQKKIAELQKEKEKPLVPSATDLEIQRLKAQLQAEREKNSAEREARREQELEAYRRKHYPELYQPKPVPQPQPKPTPKVVAPVVLEDLDEETDSELTDEELAELAEAAKKNVRRTQQPPKQRKSHVRKHAPLSDATAVTYFDDDAEGDEDAEPTQVQPTKKTTRVKPKPTTKEPAEKEVAEKDQPAEAKTKVEKPLIKAPASLAQTNATSTAISPAAFKIDVNGKKSTWRLPD